MTRDRGSMTVWALAAMSVVGLAAVLALAYGTAVTGRHRAETAADLAALAAAVHLPDGQAGACAAAGSVAAANGAVLRACRVGGDEVEVEVSRAVDLGRLGIHPAVARARAGPVTPP